MVMRVSGRLIGVGLVMSLCGWSVAHAAPAADALTDLSLEELSNLEVTSVSKSAELLKQAPAS
ncbi:MAG: hypothetical protein ACJ8MH_04305, partial [Povalibacter sp.]